jgi:hypothetical protein
LQGAACDDGYHLTQSDSMQHNLTTMMFEWRKLGTNERNGDTTDKHQNLVEVPVYADESRKMLLFCFEMWSDLPCEYFVESSIAIIAK